MKTALPIWIWTALCLLALDCQTADGASAPTAIARASAPVAIDGKLTEPVWRESHKTRVDFKMREKGIASDLPIAKAQFAWDDYYFYIAYETYDENVVADTNGKFQGPKGNKRYGAHIHAPKRKMDVVEFFISFGSPNVFWEIHHNANNQFNDVLIVRVDPKSKIAESTLNCWGQIFLKEEYLADDGPHTLAMASALKPGADGLPASINDGSNVDSGYTAEIRIPWRSLGAPAKKLEVRTPLDDPEAEAKRPPRKWLLKGQMMHILSVCENGDLKPTYYHSSPSFKGGWFHQGFDDWLVYKLTDAKN